MTGVALIGTGMWAQRLGSAAARAGVDVVSCYGRDEGRRLALAERLGCAAAPTLDAALEDASVEGVLIVTPNDAHEAPAVAAAARGKHVFVEKPIADTLEAGHRIRDACERAGVALMVGHCFRRLGATRKAKELVDAGALGRVVLAEANFSLPGTFTPEAWRWYRERNQGGPLTQLGIHHADTLAYLLGPVARTTGRFARVRTDAEIDDVGVATLELESGGLAALVGSYVSPKTYSLRLLGTDAVLDLSTEMSVWPNAERMDGATTLLLAGEPVGFEERDMLAEELEEFARCCRGEAVPETGAAEGLAALRVIVEAVESSGNAGGRER